MQRLIGKVVHYYDRIGVAIVDLKEPLSIGDMIMLKKGGTIVPQRVESMQIEHASVCSAKRGDVIGLKVDAEAHEGTLVLPG
ncbi:translation elongation factor-like protein [Candidatus Peribacteria bacterium]|nr:translation elongation factor-like protein [Candidatus Peribacteria bacterium]